MSVAKELNISKVFTDTFRNVGADWLALLVLAVPLAFIPEAISAAVDYGYIPNVVLDMLDRFMGPENEAVDGEILFQPFSYWRYLWASVIGWALTSVLSLILIVLVVGRSASRKGLIPSGWGRLIAIAVFEFPRLLLIYLASHLLIGLGLVLLIIPGLWLYTILCLSLQVGVVEGSGVARSFARSGALTEGHRWRVFAALLIVLVASALSVMSIAFVSTMLPTILGYSDPIFIFVSDGLLLAAFVAVFYLFQAEFSAVLYYALRQTSEGLLATEVSETFE